jgi:cytochrome b561
VPRIEDPPIDRMTGEDSAGASAYDLGTVSLHWVLAALIGAAVFTGFVMVDLPFSPQRFRFFNWHKWIGVAALALSAMRVVWRASRRRAPAPPAMPAWQGAAYRATHVAFYALFFIVPVLGWLYTSAVGVPVVFLGVLPLPDLIGVDKPFGDAVLKPVHAVSAYALAGLVVLHTAAALKHQFVDRDHLMARMWPRRSTRARP